MSSVNAPDIESPSDRNIIAMIAVQSDQRDQTDLYLQSAIITIYRLRQYINNWDIHIFVDEYTFSHYGELYSNAGATVIRLINSNIDHELFDL